MNYKKNRKTGRFQPTSRHRQKIQKWIAQYFGYPSAAVESRLRDLEADMPDAGRRLHAVCLLWLEIEDHFGFEVSERAENHILSDRATVGSAIDLILYHTNPRVHHTTKKNYRG